MYIYDHKPIANMNMQSITLNDVLASHTKYPNAVLCWDPKSYRDLKKINKKAKFDVTWVNLKFIMASGQKVPCRLALENQIIASGAKAPQSKDEGDDDISTFTIQFKRLERKDIEGGDYVPRTMEDPTKQENEVRRVKENIDGYMENNAKLIQVLNILNESFVKVANEIIEAEHNQKLDFTVQKDRKKKEVQVHPIMQTTRYDEVAKEDVKLPTSIFRIKLPVYKKDGRIGTWNTFKDCFKPIVYDARKMTKKNGYKPVPAYVRSNKKKVELNVKNVQGFITYKSLIMGSINFESATISKAGISFGNKFNEIYIVRHKSSSVREVINTELISKMRGFLGSDDEGSDVEIDDSKAGVKNEKKGSDDDGATDDDDGNQYVPNSHSNGNNTSDGEALDDGADDPPSDVENPNPSSEDSANSHLNPSSSNPSSSNPSSEDSANSHSNSASEDSSEKGKKIKKIPKKKN